MHNGRTYRTVGRSSKARERHYSTYRTTQDVRWGARTYLKDISAKCSRTTQSGPTIWTNVEDIKTDWHSTGREEEDEQIIMKAFLDVWRQFVSRAIF